MIVIFGLVDSWLRVMLDPATIPNAVEDAVLAVPDVAPPAAEVMVVRTDPPAPGVGPIIVRDGLVESWLNVMFGPATNENAVDEAVFTVPDVAPPAVDAIATSVE